MAKPISKIFKAGKKFVSELDEGQSPSRGVLDVEAGRAGKVTQATGTTMKEAASVGSRSRAKLVAQLETKAEKGIITKSEQSILNRLNALSAEQDVARTTAASKTKRDAASKAKGVSLAGQEGIIKAKPTAKLKDSDMMVGNTTNGITKFGEVIGNPTDNQINTVIRNMNARETLSAEAKKNLQKLQRLTKKQLQDRALRTMERNLKDTGPDRRAVGGVIQSRPRKGHTDYRKGGLFK